MIPDPIAESRAQKLVSRPEISREHHISSDSAVRFDLLLREKERVRHAPRRITLDFT